MASIYGTESSTGWQLRLDYSYTQNISANTSTITATLYVYAGISPSYNQNANGAYYTIQGTKTWNPYSYTSRGWKELGTKTWTENHNADGTLALTLSGFWCSDITSSSYTPYSLSVNGGITLPTIPRASSITCGVCVIGSDAKITINRASTNFTHNLSYSWQGLSGTIATGVATNYTWAVPTTFYAKIPNAKSANGTITCDTYNGSTKIGTTTYSFTASVDETTCKPTISPTAYDTNSTATALTGDSSVFVKYCSNAYVSMGATAKNGASIKTYSISCGGKSISTAYGTIPAVESGTVVFTATDSRGLSTSQTLEKTLVNYIKLTCDLTATASTTDGKATLDISGNYFNSSFGSSTNTLAVYYRYKVQNGEYSSWISAGTASINGNKYTRKTSITGLDYTQTYIFQARAVDKLTDISSIELERTTTPIFDWGKDGFEFHVPVSFQGKTMAEMLNLNGDAITGTLPVSKGGTGATTASQALTNLGALPLTGGRMVNTTASKGVIDHPGNSSGWGNGRDNAFIRRSKAISDSGTYYPLISSKTVNGDWTIGTLSNNLYVNYANDTDYNASNNKLAQQFWFSNNGNLYVPGGIAQLATGTLGANVSATVSAYFDGTVYKNLLILIKSYANNGNLYSSFAIPAKADTWKFFLPTYNDYYRAAVTITGTGGGMRIVAQMDSNYSGGICWIYGTM